MTTTIDCDTDTFESLYQEHREAALTSVAVVTSAQDADQEDAVQTAALNVWRLLKGGAPGKKIKTFKAYFKTASINSQRNEERRRGEEPAENVLEISNSPGAIDLTNVRELWAKRRAWLPGAVDILPLSERKVVRLRLGGLQDGEISRRLGIAHDSVPVVHSRAVARLKKMARMAGLLGDSSNLSLEKSNPC
jgi:RNA polymerase sigma factor (sigma-70 family)